MLTRRISAKKALLSRLGECNGAPSVKDDVAGSKGMKVAVVQPDQCSTSPVAAFLAWRGNSDCLPRTSWPSFGNRMARQRLFGRVARETLGDAVFERIDGGKYAIFISWLCEWILPSISAPKARKRTSTIPWWWYDWIRNCVEM